MIAKQTTGRDFAGALAYVAGKHGAARIGGNMAGETRQELVDEFRVSEGLNQRVERTVYHVSLSTLPDETIDDRTWRAIARRYLKEMGFRENQWVMYRHQDTDHHHVHILAARVQISDGRAVSDAWNYPRSEKALRAIECDFGLHKTPSSRELTQRAQRAPKTGEMRMMRRTGATSVRVVLQEKVGHAAAVSRSVGEFFAQLAADGVEVRLRKDKDGTILGASFAYEGIAFQGRQLGADYSWTALGTRLLAETPPIQEEPAPVPATAPRRDVPREHPKEPQRTTQQRFTTTEGGDDMAGTRRELRQRYLELQARVRERVVGIERNRRLQDVAVAILALRAWGDLAQTRALLTQSDRVRELGRTLNGEEYREQALRYITEVTGEAIERTAERKEAAVER